MRRLLVTCVAAATALLGWGAGPARAETPPSTPRLEITSSAAGTSRFSEGLHDRRALPRYAPRLVEEVSGREVPVENAHATRITGSDYETYGFASAEELAVGTPYRVSLRVTTVGWFDCDPQGEEGCSWRRPTDLTYAWTFVLRGADTTWGTPSYPPVTTTLDLQVGSWRRGARTTRFTGRSVPSRLCLCRTTVVEGWTRGRWVPLRTAGELGTVTLRVPPAVRRLRLVAPVATTTRADGGTVTWQAATSAAVTVPRAPR
jgi:hypothetical protein